MVRLTVLYPRSESSHFDMDYYLQTHIPLAKQLLTPLGLVRIDLEEGLAGGAPDAPPAYHLIGSLSFDTIEDLQRTIENHGEKLMADIPNYTNSQPQLLISRVIEINEPALPV